ncbi:hypothetical protein FGO68_gene17266 [Halteria grandinella]|uniref:Uncharacterized protein n=1 Tax=Halteria grandinella TaxID=5974 RepID=A0A8J8SXM1_HALGN|nr:hypothetical protein FGO68_gene17266 [Halteria grandinella]
MRLIIPQKLIESVRRDLVIHYEALGVLHLTHSGVSADSLESKLLALQPESAAFWEEMERQTDLATWKGSRICVVLNHQLFNLIDSLLEGLVLEREGKPQGAQEIDGKIQKVIKYLKVTTIYTTHIYYFSSVDRIVSLFFLYQREKNLAMLEEIIAVIITLTSKHNNEKKPSNVQGLGMESFHKDIGQVMDQLNCLLRSFDLILDLTMSKDASKEQVLSIVSQKIESLQQQLSLIKEGDVDKKEASLSQLRTRHQIDIVTWIKQLLERPEPAQTSLEDASVLVFRSINTYRKVLFKIQVNQQMWVTSAG